MAFSKQKHWELVNELLTQYPLLDEDKAREIIDWLINFWGAMIDNIDVLRQ